jgi:hypothetical protein
MPPCGDAEDGIANASGDRFAGAFNVIRRAAVPAAEAVGGGELLEEDVEFLSGLRRGLTVAGDLRVVDVLSQFGYATLVGRPGGVVDDRLGGADVDGEFGVESFLD